MRLHTASLLSVAALLAPLAGRAQIAPDSLEETDSPLRFTSSWSAEVGALLNASLLERAALEHREQPSAVLGWAPPRVDFIRLSFIEAADRIARPAVRVAAARSPSGWGGIETESGLRNQLAQNSGIPVVDLGR